MNCLRLLGSIKHPEITHFSVAVLDGAVLKILW